MFGYRYDTETGLYYLQSRYYNADWGRFINADDVIAETGRLISSNMFTYCMNNPVNMADPDGNIAWWIVGGAIGTVAGGIAGAIISYKTTGKVNWRYVAGGAVAGALVGSGAGALAQSAYDSISGVGATTAIAISRQVYPKLKSGFEFTKHAYEMWVDRFQGKLPLNKLDKLMNSANTLRYYDNRSGNINIYLSSEYSRSSLMRITISSSGKRIVSLGFEGTKNIAKYVKNGKMVQMK